jgi:hypothetical protein
MTSRSLITAVAFATLALLTACGGGDVNDDDQAQADGAGAVTAQGTGGIGGSGMTTQATGGIGGSGITTQATGGIGGSGIATH